MSISIVSPKNKSLVRGPFHLRLDASQNLEGKNVALYVNGQLHGTFAYNRKVLVSGLPTDKLQLTVAVNMDGEMITSEPVKILNQSDDKKETQEERAEYSNDIEEPEPLSDGVAANRCHRCHELIGPEGCGCRRKKPPHKVDAVDKVPESDDGLALGDEWEDVCKGCGFALSQCGCGGHRRSRSRSPQRGETCDRCGQLFGPEGCGCGGRHRRSHSPHRRENKCDRCGELLTAEGCGCRRKKPPHSFTEQAAAPFEDEILVVHKSANIAAHIAEVIVDSDTQKPTNLKLLSRSQKVLTITNHSAFAVKLESELPIRTYDGELSGASLEPHLSVTLVPTSTKWFVR